MGPGNELSFAEVSVGRGRKVIYYLELSEMESLKTGEELERAWKCQSSSNNRKHVKLNKP